MPACMHYIYMHVYEDMCVFIKACNIEYIPIFYFLFKFFSDPFITVAHGVSNITDLRFLGNFSGDSNSVGMS